MCLSDHTSWQFAIQWSSWMTGSTGSCLQVHLLQFLIACPQSNLHVQIFNAAETTDFPPPNALVSLDHRGGKNIPDLKSMANYGDQWRPWTLKLKLTASVYYLYKIQYGDQWDIRHRSLSLLTMKGLESDWKYLGQHTGVVWLRRPVLISNCPGGQKRWRSSLWGWNSALWGQKSQYFTLKGKDPRYKSSTGCFKIFALRGPFHPSKHTCSSNWGLTHFAVCRLPIICDHLKI